MGFSVRFPDSVFARNLKQFGAKFLKWNFRNLVLDLAWISLTRQSGSVLSSLLLAWLGM
jgi:hypothetical protein